MRSYLRPALFLAGMVCASLQLNAELPYIIQQNAPTAEAMRELQHQDPQWQLLKEHLPNPETASPQQLEMVGDVLRARRFPQDALDYYVYALKRGGDEETLMKKLGITQLDLRHTAAARAYFLRAVRLQRKDSIAWNNLGAVEYIDGRFGTAISDYMRAIKLDKKSAAFHANLATAYFDQRNYKQARQQFKIALELDPEVATHDNTGGLTAHTISPEDHARYCFEMAKLYAELGDQGNMLHYLTMASEAGFDVIGEMYTDPALDRYRKDPRVLLLVRNAKALRNGTTSSDRSAAKIPTLPPVQPN
jgi:tetratricopeptide (TPR) repeat protein